MTKAREDGVTVRAIADEQLLTGEAKAAMIADGLADLENGPEDGNTVARRAFIQLLIINAEEGRMHSHMRHREMNEALNVATAVARKAQAWLKRVMDGGSK